MKFLAALTIHKRLAAKTRKTFDALIQRPSSPKPRIPDLPTEVIENIATWLQASDISSLRLSCRMIERKLVYHFGSTYLPILKTDLSLGSLEALQTLARHKDLRPYVRTLHFAVPDEAPSLTRGYYFGKGFGWTRNRSGILVFPITQVQMLKEILINELVNCRSFCIDVWTEDRELPHDENCLTSSDILAIVLYLVSDPAIRILSLEIGLHNGQTTMGIETSRLYIEDSRKPGLKSPFAHLRDLSFRQIIYNNNAPWAANLISNAPSLQKLNLDDYNDQEFSLIARLASLNFLPPIQDLTLSSAHAALEVTIQFLLRLRSSLRRLKFRSFWIRRGGTWVSLLSLLKRDFPLLESIHLEFIKDGSIGTQTYVVFPTLEENPKVPGTNGERIINVRHKHWKGEKRVMGVSYEGPKIDVALDMIIESAVAV